MNTKRKYFIFIRSQKAAEIVQKYINLHYIWDSIRGAGWAAKVALSKEQLSHLKVKLWNCKYQILRVHE